MSYLYESIRPTRLYIKQCPHCGLKYFGKSTQEDIERYNGSGTRWINHLKYHNVDPVHLWTSEWYNDTSISKFALRFSRMNNIVSSESWANLKEENGLNGGFDSSSAKNGRIAANNKIKEKYGVAHAGQIPHVIENNKNKTPWNKGKTGIYNDRPDALEKIKIAASNRARVQSQSTKEKIRAAVISTNENKGIAFILKDGDKIEKIRCLKNWCELNDLDYQKVFAYINKGPIKMIRRFDSPTRRWFIGKELIRE